MLTLCTERRGEQIDLTYAGNRAMAVYRLPLNEVVFDFYDRLKSVTRGYASFDYAMDDYRAGALVKVSILVNGDPVDALSMIVHRDQAEHRGRAICIASRTWCRARCSRWRSGGDRRQGDRARDDFRASQGCDREMLWR